MRDGILNLRVGDERTNHGNVVIGIEHEFTRPMANQRRGGGKDGESAENGSKKPAPQRMRVLGTLTILTFRLKLILQV